MTRRQRKADRVAWVDGSATELAVRQNVLFDLGYVSDSHSVTVGGDEVGR